MARNEVFKNADYLSLPVDVGTLSGDAVRIGDLNGVAQTDEPTAWHAEHGAWDQHPSGNKDGYASIALVGAYRIPVAGTGTLAVGDPVFWDETAGGLTTDAGVDPDLNDVWGHALSVKGATDGQPVIVRIAN